MKSISVCLLSLMLLLVTSLASLAQTTPGYTMHQVTFPGSHQTLVYGLNDNGWMIGDYENHAGDFIQWIGSRLTYRDYSVYVPSLTYCDKVTALNNPRHTIGHYC
jgi:hypothetical protein